MTITLLNNRYQVIQVLGAGGFGETSLAEDTHMPSRRRCVIKQLKPIVNNPYNHKMMEQRFQREAATLEILGRGSDQIPELYAYFAENGEFFLVQEWIQGQTLTEIVESKGYQNETIVQEILLSLLSVLNYVHSQGIIHRDIKPDNIILRAGDQKPVLIDFGAVKETIRTVANSPQHLTHSMVIGTPGYMPSEQAVGRPVYATDIYSLGLTAVFLLTGKHPAELPTNLQTGEILWQDEAQQVSPQLAKVINQAIKPHASDRYSTASKMLYDLKSVTDVSPPSPTIATVSLSPAVTATKQTQVIPPPPTLPSRNWQKPTLIFGSLLLGGLMGGVAISRITRQQQPTTSIVTSTPAPRTNSTTTIDPTPSPQPSPTQSPDTSITTQPRSNSDVFAPQQPQRETSSPEPDESQSANSPIEPTEDIFTPQPETIPESSTVPEVPEPTQPEPTPAPQEPQNQETQNEAPSNTTTTNVPAFPTGTSEGAVKGALGQPSRVSNGLWNTRAFLYQLEPNQVDLGYLFDRNTGVLRQTEVAFAQSVQLEVMQRTLQGMLGGKSNNDIQQGLQRVYNRQTKRYSFNVGGLKGVIERNQQDRIYIGVWDADLH
jgi:serine/threonine-protein kinase